MNPLIHEVEKRMIESNPQLADKNYRVAMTKQEKYNLFVEMVNLYYQLHAVHQQYSWTVRF